MEETKKLQNTTGNKKRSKKTVGPTKEITPLEQLCSGDKEAYEALFHTIILDPRKINTSIKQAAENAKKYEKEKDVASARMWYHVAGGLAIYEGNVKKVVEYYSAEEKLTGGAYPILKNPEKAVAKAQEYYKKYLV